MTIEIDTCEGTAERVFGVGRRGGLLRDDGGGGVALKEIEYEDEGEDDYTEQEPDERERELRRLRG